MFTIRKFGFRVARERALEWRNKRREKAMQESSGRRSRPPTHANATMLLEPTPSAVSAPASAVSPSYSTSTCASTPSPSASPAAAVVPASAAAAGASSGSDALPVGSAGGTAAASSGGGSGSVEVMRSAVCHILRNLQQCISRILTSERASGADEQLAVDIHKWSQAVYVQLDLFSSFAQLACESRHPDAEALVSEMLMPYLRLFAHCIRLNKLPSQLPEEYQLLLLDALCILGTPDTAGKVELQQQQQEEALRGAAALMLPDTNADLLSLPPTPDATTPSGAASALAVSPAALATPHAGGLSMDAAAAEMAERARLMLTKVSVEAVLCLSGGCSLAAARVLLLLLHANAAFPESLQEQQRWHQCLVDYLLERCLVARRGRLAHFRIRELRISTCGTAGLSPRDGYDEESSVFKLHEQQFSVLGKVGKSAGASACSEGDVRRQSATVLSSTLSFGLAAGGVPPSLMRRLGSLSCPLPIGLLGAAFEDLVLWLETAHIRHLSRLQREEKLGKKGDGWWARFIQYCKDARLKVEASHSEDTATSRLALLRGMTNLAIKYQYEDALMENRLEGISDAGASTSRGQPMPTQHQQQTEDADAAAIVKLLHAPLNEALAALHLPPLLACESSVGETLAALQAIAARTGADTAVAGEDDCLTEEEARELLQQLPVLLGAPQGGPPGGKSPWRDFERRFASALRVLHVMELQRTQDTINEALERMQLLTADPRTDHRLARVGF
ncbi:hypothetical protein cyc_06778 [Cyclospora cayetanensis]|uniref:AP2-coincident C-terminal domain-containing protein n=1 Tax=Cyclospora cayetanensis TaxID=88456 RepID=A0A1D3CS66_9EIME|nr:hypothetical protein cyc_06778 [Cyclospora cayetanensis]